MTAADSAVRFAVSIPLLLVCIGAVIWGTNKLSKVRSRRQAIERELRDVDRRFYELLGKHRTIGEPQGSPEDHPEAEDQS